MVTPSNPETITYFAETDFRNKKTRFGIKAKDRSRHIYIIGKTGMGKSTLMENLIIQDIKNGEGVGVIDPHGSLADKVMDFVPEERINDIVYFAPFDVDFPISFNVMEDVGADKRHLVVSSLMSTFKKIWVDAWSARMEYILNNIILALLEFPGSTMLGVNRMLSDKDYRKKVVDNVQDPSVKAFWVNEFAKYGDRYMQEAGAAIQNKIGQFTANPLIRNIIGQPRSSFDVRKMMDEKKILIMNLSKGRVGEQNASLLGGMLITKIYLGAMSRADLSESVIRKLPTFYLYVDEFQSFANDTFADILSEARKYNLALSIAHQYVEQMTEDVRAAVFGNVGTTIAFRVGPMDAEILEKIFAPRFTAEDIVNLGFTQVYLTMMIDGVGSPPFSAMVLWLFRKADISFREQILDASRSTYARTRDVVEKEILEWHENTFIDKKPHIPRTDGLPPGTPPIRPPMTGAYPPPKTTSAYTPSNTIAKPTYVPRVQSDIKPSYTTPKPVTAQQVPYTAKSPAVQSPVTPKTTYIPPVQNKTPVMSDVVKKPASAQGYGEAKPAYVPPPVQPQTQSQTRFQPISTPGQVNIARTVNTASTARTEKIANYNQIRPISQTKQSRPQAPAMSPKLKDLLSQLEQEEGFTPKTSEGLRTEARRQENIKAQENTIPKIPTPTISLSSLKDSSNTSTFANSRPSSAPSAKDPSKENVNSLRDALKKAMEGREEKKQESTESTKALKHENTESTKAQEIKADENKKKVEDSTSQSQPIVSGNVKEVPEHVLKAILE